MLLSPERYGGTARRFFVKALATAQSSPLEVITDRAASYGGVMDELLPGAVHNVEQHATNRIEADHGRRRHGFRRCGA